MFSVYKGIIQKTKSSTQFTTFVNTDVMSGATHSLVSLLLCWYVCTLFSFMLMIFLMNKQNLRAMLIHNHKCCIFYLSVVLLSFRWLLIHPSITLINYMFWIIDLPAMYEQNVCHLTYMVNVGLESSVLVHTAHLVCCDI